MCVTPEEQVESISSSLLQLTMCLCMVFLLGMCVGASGQMLGEGRPPDQLVGLWDGGASKLCFNRVEPTPLGCFTPC